MPGMLHVSDVVFVSSSDADRLVWLLFCRYPPTPASIPSAAPRDTDHKRLVAPESIDLQGLQTPCPRQKASNAGFDFQLVMDKRSVSLDGTNVLRK
ncbi:hypothetical protein HDV62DRAFT_368748 [Trichoderma sp. SZMC 28011]